jgi:hypothetical protein
MHISDALRITSKSALIFGALLSFGASGAPAPSVFTSPSVGKVDSSPLLTGSGGGGGALQITTDSLPNVAIGTAYSQALSCRGGVLPCTYSLVNSRPNTGFWHYISPSGAVTGTPTDLDETETDTFQVTDATGATAIKQITIGVTASGTLAIASPPTLPTVASGGISAWKLIATGGDPYYMWSSGDCIQSNNNCSLSWDGWLRFAPTSRGTVTFHVQVMDQQGTTQIQTLTGTVNDALQLAQIDPIDKLIHLPPATVGSLYRAYLNAWGGTRAGLTFSCTSSCPSWVRIRGNVLSGTPVFSGNVEPVLKVVDSGAHSASATALINISSSAMVTRPSGTPSGVFFVKNGLIYDRNGNPFLPVGLDQTHWDDVTYNRIGTNAALSETNIDRIATDFANLPSITRIISNYILPNDVVPLISMFYFPANSKYGCLSTEAATGSSDTACFAAGMQDWVSAESTLASFNSAGMFNIANEWGNAGSAWANAYAYVAAPIAGVSGSTVTITSPASTNPFAKTPVAYPSGSCGIRNQVVIVTATGGSSGLWTVTTRPALSGWTSGCTLYGGAVGIMRGSGYTAPLVIDAPGSGQDYSTFLKYATGVQASDPEQNLIFSIHLYGNVDNTRERISNITSEKFPKVSLNSALPYHPFEPAYPMVTSNTYSGIYGYTISEVSGTMSSINGTDPALANICQAPCSKSWNVTVLHDTTGLTYGGGGVITGSNYYATVISALAALRSTNVATMIGEFGVSGNDAGGPLVAFNGSINSGATQMTVTSMLAGSAPILPNGMYLYHDGKVCAVTNSQIAGTRGGIGSYSLWTGASCAGVSGIFNYAGWGDGSPSNALASEIISAAYSNSIGVIPWSWDDHRNRDGSANFAFQFDMTPLDTTTCPNSGCYSKPSDLAMAGQDYMFNPRYGSLALSQKAPALH